MSEKGKTDKELKQASIQRGLFSGLFFAFIGILVSFWWLAGYIFSKSNKIDFMAARMGDMTREYLEYVFSFLGLVVMNAGLTPTDIVIITATMSLIVIAFGLGGFVLGRLVHRVSS